MTDTTSSPFTASGKVILLGEHAVVHGAPAVVAGLDRGASVRAVRSESPQITFGGSAVASDHELFSALDAASRVLGAPTANVDIELNLPAGSGLGASAAIGVATARALAHLTSTSEEPHHVVEERVAKAADAWEGVFHGNASGVDRTAAQQGGILRFVRGDAPTPVSLRHPLSLVVAVAGPPANTKTMVDGVAHLKAKNPAQFGKNLAAIHSLVDNAIVCLRGGDFASLGQLMDLNQMLLAGWMLSTEGIESACAIARNAGALGAKLTGSGGGGCIVALCNDWEAATSSDKVADALTRAGFDAFSTRIDADTHHCHDHEHHHD